MWHRKERIISYSSNKKQQREAKCFYCLQLSFYAIVKRKKVENCWSIENIVWMKYRKPYSSNKSILQWFISYDLFHISTSIYSLKNIPCFHYKYKWCHWLIIFKWNTKYKNHHNHKYYYYPKNKTFQLIFPYQIFMKYIIYVHIYNICCLYALSKINEGNNSAEIK